MGRVFLLKSLAKFVEHSKSGGLGSKDLTFFTESQLKCSVGSRFEEEPSWKERKLHFSSIQNKPHGVYTR